jgi:glutamate/tyrosine decarboxylase-like PLP-dependent enzyme
VITPEEGAVPQGLGTLGDCEEVGVRGALLRFGEDTEVGELHARRLEPPVRDTVPMAPLQQHGRAVDDVIGDLAAKRVNDIKWADGRTFGMVYDGGPSVHEVAEQAARMYLHENALNTQAFPSLREIQSDVVGWTAGLLHGDA